jgi:hypothetical protein
VNVIFRKTGARRYGVWVERELASALMMDPAPGFDEYLPHDLLHFVAEAEWGLDGAVFGRLASGADAGTFWPVDQALVRKAMRRRKQTRMRPRGMRSELLAGILEAAWYARRGRPLPKDWDHRLAAARAEPADVERVASSLDELAERWHSLHLGESLSLVWPRPEGRRRPTAAAPRRRRSAARRRPAPRA